MSGKTSTQSRHRPVSVEGKSVLIGLVKPLRGLKQSTKHYIMHALRRGEIADNSEEQDSSQRKFWYAVEVGDGLEGLVCDDLCKQGFDVYFPLRFSHQAAASDYLANSTPLIPGYLFVCADPNGDDLEEIGKVQNVSGFMQFGGTVQPMSESVMEDIRLRENDSQYHWLPYTQGKRVRVVSGPLVDTIGSIYGRDDDHDNRIVITVSVLGREIRVKLPIEAIELEVPIQPEFLKEDRKAGESSRVENDAEGPTQNQFDSLRQEAEREPIQVPYRAEQILYLLLPKDDREYLPGCLFEEYVTEIAPKFGMRYARVWYWKQVLSSIAPVLRRRLLEGIGILLAGKWLW